MGHGGAAILGQGGGIFSRRLMLQLGTVVLRALGQIRDQTDGICAGPRGTQSEPPQTRNKPSNSLVSERV